MITIRISFEQFSSIEKSLVMNWSYKSHISKRGSKRKEKKYGYHERSYVWGDRETLLSFK